MSILREYISVAPAERTVEILVRQHCFPVAYYLMNLRIDHAQSDDAPIIAQMVGELLREITAMVGTSVSGFHEEETETRARSWMADGKYSILLARDGVQPESLGFLALYESFALYTEGAFGTIPEFYVRRAYRSQGVGTLLLSEAKRIGQSKGWRRLEVTTPPLPQFDGTLTFYQREGFSISGGRKLKLELS
ncbi:MAG TPA: GNAT family N-acetyltransferase [Nitrospiraceae bacterium]|nr:GNAT family N-acetyltransferase [Nitrospiraceae bacterium]